MWFEVMISVFIYGVIYCLIWDVFILIGKVGVYWF